MWFSFKDMKIIEEVLSSEGIIPADIYIESSHSHLRLELKIELEPNTVRQYNTIFSYDGYGNVIILNALPVYRKILEILPKVNFSVCTNEVYGNVLLPETLDFLKEYKCVPLRYAQPSKSEGGHGLKLTYYLGYPSVKGYSHAAELLNDITGCRNEDTFLKEISYLESRWNGRILTLQERELQEEGDCMTLDEDAAGELLEIKLFRE
jgi:hypothetical protein